MHKKGAKNILASTIIKSLRKDTGEFEWDTFFNFWFRERGTPCFFLFKRNLGVTNMQYVEVFSLLETYCVDQGTGEPKKQLIFQTTDQLRSTIVEALNVLLDVPKSDKKSQVNDFAEIYSEVFCATLAVDMFYNSCAVFVPPGLSIDLEKICSDGGYIHSVGRSIFIRNIKKARQKDFESSIDAHLKRMGDENLPVPFVVYAHEDFSDFDTDSKDEIKRGIDGTKIFVEKVSMGSNRLAQIISDFREKFDGKLTVPDAGSYKTRHKFQDLNRPGNLGGCLV